MIYAGIGSRETPPETIDHMNQIGCYLGMKGWTLRSGGAPGADTAFEQGCNFAPGKKEIYIPWNNFNGRSSMEPSVHVGVCPRAMALADMHHPAFHRCKEGAKKLHARNCYQVLGKDLVVPADMVICWTRGGRGEGGTGQALRLARHIGIPIYDLGSPGGLESLMERIA